MEPGFLGVSQGAAFGAVVAILLFGDSLPAIQAASAVCGILGLGLVYQLAHKIRFGGWILRLILSGLAVSALFTAGIGIVKYAADPLTQLPEITFWLLGGLSHISWGKLIAVTPAVCCGLITLLLFRWRVNLLTLSDETSFALGSQPERIRLVLILAATVSVAAVISVSGIVLWLGLIVPHLARRIFGADGRHSLPASLLIGGIFALGGPGTVTWKALIRIIAQASGKRKIALPVPVAPVKAAAMLLDRFPFFPVTVDQITMLLEGNTCDATAFDLFGIAPVSFITDKLAYLV